MGFSLDNLDLRNVPVSELSQHELQPVQTVGSVVCSPAV
jgi:hypothetical protein